MKIQAQDFVGQVPQVMYCILYDLYKTNLCLGYYTVYNNVSTDLWCTDRSFLALLIPWHIMMLKVMIFVKLSYRLTLLQHLKQE
jgi:hypothetical protein